MEWLMSVILVVGQVRDDICHAIAKDSKLSRAKIYHIDFDTLITKGEFIQKEDLGKELAKAQSDKQSVAIMAEIDRAFRNFIFKALGFKEHAIATVIFDESSWIRNGDGDLGWFKEMSSTKICYVVTSTGIEQV